MVLLNCSWINGHSMTQSLKPLLLFETRAPCIGSGISNDVLTVFKVETGKGYAQFEEVIFA